MASLDVPTFRLAARLSGRVPLVAIVSGYCFVGNAALADTRAVLTGVLARVTAGG